MRVGRKQKSEFADINKKDIKSEKPIKKKKPHFDFLETFFIFLIVFSLIGAAVLLGWNLISNFKITDGQDIEVLEETVEVPPPIIGENSPFFKAFQDSKRVNILLMGTAQNLTDTIMLASFDLESKDLDIISVPRDTYYHRSGYDTDAEKKINAAYRKNPLNTVHAVSDLLSGMPIHYYAVIDYEGVENIVDAMGGVPMDIPFPMEYYDGFNLPSPLRIDIPEGKQVLDGEHAVQFIRYRSGYSDEIGRVKAQQEFVKSAIKQCLSFKLPKIVATVFSNVESNLTLGVATKMATGAKDMKSDNVTTHMLPYTFKDGEPYAYPTESEIEDLLFDIYSIKEDKATGSGISEDVNNKEG